MAIKESDIIICGHGSGTPSTKNMLSYLTTRYNSLASNGKHKGLVKVMRLKVLDDDGRKLFHDTYKTILGRNGYNQNLRQYVYTPYNGKYYSDCSSSGCATFKKIGYNVPLLNTAGIYQSNLFEEVNVTIKNGHVTNPELLKVGDCLLFVGNDASRPLQIGHVEYVYEINGLSQSIPTTNVSSLVDKGMSEAKKFITNNTKEITVLNVKQMVLQTALNKDYKSNLVVDGAFGSKSNTALGSHYVKKGEKQYMVTAAEILMYLNNINPNGVEYPGSYGSGLVNAAKIKFGGDGSKITSTNFLSLLK